MSQKTAGAVVLTLQPITTEHAVASINASLRPLDLQPAAFY